MARGGIEWMSRGIHRLLDGRISILSGKPTNYETYLKVVSIKLQGFENLCFLGVVIIWGNQPLLQHII